MRQDDQKCINDSFWGDLGLIPAELHSDPTTQILTFTNLSLICGVRWESSPWTACSTSCGGGIQSRSVSCVEEDMQGTITTTEEWKCLYSSKTAILQPCNAYDCPTWLAQEWSPVGPLLVCLNTQF